MLCREYKDLNEAYFGINREILKTPQILDYLENTRGIIEDLFFHIDSINCNKIDLGPLGYSDRKWGHLVRTYIDENELRNFYHLCEISKGVSIAYDFKRKTTGNGSCMREIILTRKNRKKCWTNVRVIWRATELQKRWAADLILLHHLISQIPNLELAGVDFYIVSAYQSGMYVIPLVESVFGVDMEDIIPDKHPYWKVIRYRNQKYFQPDSPPQKLSPAIQMQKVQQKLRDGTPFPQLTYDKFKLEV